MHTTSVYSNRDVADTLSAVERSLIAEGQVTDELDCPMTGILLISKIKLEEFQGLLSHHVQRNKRVWIAKTICILIALYEWKI